MRVLQTEKGVKQAAYAAAEAVLQAAQDVGTDIDHMAEQVAVVAGVCAFGLAGPRVTETRHACVCVCRKSLQH